MAIDRSVWQWKRETDTGSQWPVSSVLFGCLKCLFLLFYFYAAAVLFIISPQFQGSVLDDRQSGSICIGFSTGTIPASSAWAWPGVLAKLPSTSSMQRRRKWAISCSILRRWCGPFSIPTYFSSLAMTSSRWSLVQCIREPKPLRCAGIPRQTMGTCQAKR